MNRCHRVPPGRETPRRIIRGFTLIELMIVVAIIGILAAIALPNFALLSCRSKTTEAKVALRTIAFAQMTYKAEKGTYFAAEATTLEDFGVDFPGAGVQVDGKRKYNYGTTVDEDGGGFVAVATGEGMLAGDIWQVDESLAITHLDTACE